MKLHSCEMISRRGCCVFCLREYLEFPLNAVYWLIDLCYSWNSIEFYLSIIPETVII